MIKVTIYKTDGHKYAGFDISGHAGYDESGNDVVCAAVSAIVINTINSIERFTEDETSSVSDEESGTIEFTLFSRRCKNHDENESSVFCS